MAYGGTMRSKHLSVWIAVAPDVVYAYASDPRQLATWAAGLAQGGLRLTSQGWVADSPMGEVTVEFTPTNTLGVLDHVVRLPSGEAVYNPMRVVPAGVDAAECEVVFTVRQRPGVTEEEFEADVAAVAADLETLRRLLESQ
ncbi:polyketide cyclase/dehydrase and lipid transport [Mycolicibacterium farcinogenes]|uniref:Polyketide cyclase / dehydrase and lipid transport n=2 Tax=Mycobacteriaceae TaxID=1762 RepID=A0A378T1N5_9MYCO|nr:polyketide cyclase/dehydrase and lipid transport [Mycolicibacterium farcinogenes]STZ54699.1 Polyketide cyclase / dehydrase and lipid transport [Mycolicibacterium senegalense]